MTHPDLERPPRLARIHDPLFNQMLEALTGLGYTVQDNLLFPPESGLAPAAPMIPPEIQAVIENLHTQDNRITESPLFGVQEKRIVGGLDDDYADGWTWITEDSEEVHDAERIERLEAQFTAGDSRPEGCRRVGHIERWEFVTGCLTEAGCKAFIACNGHNLREPRIYAYGSYRNAEWIALRKWLMSLRGLTTLPAQQ